MRRRGANGDRNLSGCDASDAMRDRQTHVTEASRNFGGDSIELRKRQRFVGFILQRRYGTAIVGVANDAYERHDTAKTRRSYAILNGTRIDCGTLEGHAHPPPTGGKIASS